MPHKFNPEGIEKLLREDRLHPVTARDFLLSEGLKSGMVLADIGCGPGFFVKPASEIVGKDGRVYAVDMQQEMLDELTKRFHAQNVKTVRSEESSIPLNDSCADIALVAFVFHEAERRADFLKEVSRILKSGGSLLLLDWEKKLEDKGPPFEDRIEANEALKYTVEAGFKEAVLKNLNQSHYLISAKR